MSPESSPLRHACAALACLALLGSAGIARASLPRVRPAEPMMGPLAPPGPLGRIAGFRTAQFGMTEAEVAAALKADMPYTDGPPRVAPNTLERTRVMTVGLAALGPFPGSVSLNYIFGAKSHVLIQVTAIWTLAPGASAQAPVQMALAGRAYAQRMSRYSWRATSVDADAPMDQALPLLDAYDQRGARVQLTATPMQGEAAGFRRLTLSFSQNPGHPDVFRIKPGDF